MFSLLFNYSYLFLDDFTMSCNHSGTIYSVFNEQENKKVKSNWVDNGPTTNREIPSLNLWEMFWNGMNIVSIVITVPFVMYSNGRQKSVRNIFVSLWFDLFEDRKQTPQFSVLISVCCAFIIVIFRFSSLSSFRQLALAFFASSLLLCMILFDLDNESRIHSPGVRSSRSFGSGRT